MEKKSITIEKKIKKIEECKFTEDEKERISIYITNIIREIDTNLAEKLLARINKDGEENSMRFGQELVNYWYEGVAKGEEKRKKRR